MTLHHYFIEETFALNKYKNKNSLMTLSFKKALNIDLDFVLNNYRALIERDREREIKCTWYVLVRSACVRVNV